MLHLAVILILVLGFYFFIFTKGSLILQAYLGNKNDPRNNIYWIYKSPFLIWLTDRQFIPSTILLWNYNKMVQEILERINESKEAKSILQMACVFGNCSELILNNSINLKHITFLDLMPSEIKNLRKKLKHSRNNEKCSFLIENASKTSLEDNSQDFIIIFFLFHELPYNEKILVLKEASRVLKPNGKIIFGEFHKPQQSLLKILGKCYFKVFEPYAKEMWTFNPVAILEKHTGKKWSRETTTYSRGNYQITSLSAVNCSIEH